MSCLSARANDSNRHLFGVSINQTQNRNTNKYSSWITPHGTANAFKYFYNKWYKNRGDDSCAITICKGLGAFVITPISLSLLPLDVVWKGLYIGSMILNLPHVLCKRNTLYSRSNRANQGQDPLLYSRSNRANQGQDPLIESFINPLADRRTLSQKLFDYIADSNGQGKELTVKNLIISVALFARNALISVLALAITLIEVTPKAVKCFVLKPICKVVLFVCLLMSGFKALMDIDRFDFFRQDLSEEPNNQVDEIQFIDIL